MGRRGFRQADPTENEIAAACLEIRSGWTLEEEQKRAGQKVIGKKLIGSPHTLIYRYGWADMGGGACRKQKRSELISD